MVGWLIIESKADTALKLIYINEQTICNYKKYKYSWAFFKIQWKQFFITDATVF